MKTTVLLCLAAYLMVAQANYYDGTKLGSLHGLNPGCDVSQETLTKYGMECLAKDPSLMVQVIEHMEHPDTMANMKFVCDNKADIVDVAICMEDKLAPCLPKAMQTSFVKYLSKQRLGKVLGFVCEHQSEVNQECMDDQSSMMFTQCMQTQGQMIGALLAATTQNPTGKDIRGALCRFNQGYQACLSKHHGSCTNKFVNIMDRVMEMLLPADVCEGVDLKKDESMLSALLLHGVPLKYQPEGNNYGYNIPA